MEYVKTAQQFAGDPGFLFECFNGLEGFVQLSPGAISLLGSGDGTVVCKGERNTEQCMTPESLFIQVDTGYYHSLGLREDGTIEGWGLNSSGQCEARR